VRAQVLGTQEAVEAVLKCLATPDEAVKLAPYVDGKRPLADLAPAERFILELHRVPQIEARLATYMYKFTLPESIDEMLAVAANRRRAIAQVRPAASVLANACASLPCRLLGSLMTAQMNRLHAKIRGGAVGITRDDTDPIVAGLNGAKLATARDTPVAAQVCKSEAFRAALTGVLALGNFLNAGSTNGDAVAFKLQALTKLPDTKSLDGDHSLLTFLAATLLNAGLAPIADEVPAAFRTSMDISMEVPAFPSCFCVVRMYDTSRQVLAHLRSPPHYILWCSALELH
jgi:Formin Homology 2 Domain